MADNMAERGLAPVSLLFGLLRGYADLATWISGPSSSRTSAMAVAVAAIPGLSDPCHELRNPPNGHGVNPPPFWSPPSRGHRTALDEEAGWGKKNA